MKNSVSPCRAVFSIHTEDERFMRLHLNDTSTLKMPFLAGGTIAGLLASAWYLYRNLARQPLPGHLPDPLWTRFVNVALILFAAIYLANLLRRVVEPALRKGKGD